MTKLTYTVIAASLLLAWTQVAIADGMPDDNDGTTPAPAHHSTRKHKAAQKKEPKVRDPLAVNPSVAVKDTPAKEIELPGVMKLDGANKDLIDPTRARVIPLSPISQTVYVSDSKPNLILLPFKNPKIVGTDALHIDKGVNSNKVYLSFETLTKSEQLFLESQDGSRVASVEVVPKQVPSQTIIIVDDSPTNNKAGKGNDHFSTVQNLLETVALGGAPDGYSVVQLNLPPMSVDGLMVDAEKRLSNVSGDIYVYSVTNTGKTTAEVKETEFDGDDIDAVSIFPKPVLQPGEKTKVIVLSHRHRLGEGQ